MAKEQQAKSQGLGQLLALLDEWHSYGLRPKRVRLTQQELKQLWDATNAFHNPYPEQHLPWEAFLRLAGGEKIGYWGPPYMCGVELRLAA